MAHKLILSCTHRQQYGSRERLLTFYGGAMSTISKVGFTLGLGVLVPFPRNLLEGGFKVLLGLGLCACG